jgi:hypothetical protein
MDTERMKKSVLAFVRRENVVLGLVVATGLAMLLELTGVYWLMIVAGGVAGFLVKRGWRSFLIGFAAVVIGWGVYLLAYASTSPLQRFLGLVGTALGMPGEVVVVATLVIGGLMGGLGALVGAYVTQLAIMDRSPSK